MHLTSILKPAIIQVLPTFHGLDLENPYLHLREFEEVCNTYNDLKCSMNTIRLKPFPFFKKKLKHGYKILGQDPFVLGMKCNNSF
jgi:hypothetical protein